MQTNEITRGELRDGLEALGVRRGGVLLVHTSFRATGPVEGGPVSLIGALRDAIGPDGTLVMPSWTGRDDQPFEPAATAAARDLGVVADTFWRLPGVIRSDHPFAFAAAGPLAETIVSGPMTVPPHAPRSPVSRVHDLDGQVLLLGVNHDSDTTLHLAELLADVPYRVKNRITVMRDGHAVQIEYDENDHCCERFQLADGWLRAAGLQAEGMVGHAHARLVRSRDIVTVAVAELRRDPLQFLHPPAAACRECDAARASLSGSTSRCS